MIYIKNGKKYKDVNSVIINDRMIINPTHEQILQAGYEIYTFPPKTADEILTEAINNKIQEIEAYYNSDDVNLISIQGNDLYLNPDVRFKLKERLDAADAEGIEYTNIKLNGITYTISIKDGLSMYRAIVLQYAKAYDVKDEHIQNVSVLKNIEDVNSYDVKANYPTKLTL